MKRITSWGFFAIAFFFSSAGIVDAASLYIDPAVATILRGDTVTMAVRLDTDEAAGECVNAVDAVITYSEAIDLVDVSTGDSIFSVWVEPPTIDKVNRKVTFAGGIPNGYCGRVEGDPRLTNTIVELIFRSPGFSIGGGEPMVNAQVEFDPVTSVYLNDGQGTIAPLQTYGATVDLSNDPGIQIDDRWRDEVAADTVPPAEFSITLERNNTAFNGKYFIVFNTTDKQTGIDQYQVMEEPVSQLGAFTWGRADAPWVTARSPYVLEDQSLNSIIRVRAIDKAGNEYVATLLPDESLRTLTLTEYITYGASAVIVTLLLGIIYTMYKNRRKRLLAKTSEEITPVSTEHE